MRQQFGVVMEHITVELQSVCCLALEEISLPRKQITFAVRAGRWSQTLEQLREVARPLRPCSGRATGRQSLCSAVHVFIPTNPFRQQDARYGNGIVAPLTEATNDTRRLTAAALFGLKHIYRLVCQYKKADVMLLELQPEKVTQAPLSGGHDGRSERLMRLMDHINAGYGLNTLFLASCGVQSR
jgi:DNA polymerase V